MFRGTHLQCPACRRRLDDDWGGAIHALVTTHKLQLQSSDQRPTPLFHVFVAKQVRDLWGCLSDVSQKA